MTPRIIDTLAFNFKLARAWSLTECKRIVAHQLKLSRTRAPVPRALFLIEDAKGKHDHHDPPTPPLSFAAASARISPAARRLFERACAARTKAAAARGERAAVAAKVASNAAYCAFSRVATAQDAATFLAYIKDKAASAAAAAAAAPQRPAPLLPRATPAAPSLALPRTAPPSPTTSAAPSIASSSSSSSSSRSQSPTADTVMPLQRVLHAFRKLRDAVTGVEEVLASALVAPQYAMLTKALTAIAELPAASPPPCAGQGDSAELRKLAKELAPLLTEGEGALLDLPRAGAPAARQAAARKLRLATLERVRPFAGAARTWRAAKAEPSASAPLAAPAPAAAWARLGECSAPYFVDAKLNDDAAMPYSSHQGMLSSFAASRTEGSVAAVDDFFCPYSLAQRDGSPSMQLVDARHSKKNKGGRAADKRIRAWKDVKAACGRPLDVHVYVLRTGSNTKHRLGLLFHLPTRRFFVYASFESNDLTWQPRYVPSQSLIGAFRAASLAAGPGGADGALDAAAVCRGQRKRKVQ